MERKNKIIILGLVIVIIALVVGLAAMLVGNNATDNVKEGMMVFDFNSQFTMQVPNNTKFVKEWNTSSETYFGDSYSYDDESNGFKVVYMNSPLVTSEFVSGLMDIGKNKSDVSIEYEGDMILIHNMGDKNLFGDSIDASDYSHAIIIQKGHLFVGILGDDFDLIKSMAKTIRFYGEA